MYSFQYTFDGSPCGPTDSVVADAEVDVGVLPCLIFRGLALPAGRTPLRGLMMTNTLPQHLIRTSDNNPTPTDQSSASRYIKALLRQIVVDEVTSSGADSIGVCLSGGLDSGLILALLAELKAESAIGDVMAFHLAWRNIHEMDSERATAAAMCDAVGVRLVTVDCSDLSLRDILACTDELCMPWINPYYPHYRRIVHSAADRGVQLIMTGFGSEQHFESGHLPTVIDRLAHGQPHAIASWPQTQGLAAALHPPWTTQQCNQSQYRTFGATTTAEHAQWLARIYGFNSVLTSMAIESFLFAREFPELPFSYPYLDQRLMPAVAATSDEIHALRVGGQLYNKALLRRALAEYAPSSVYLRCANAPFEAVEQHCLRADWEFFVDFWSRPSHLAELGFLDSAWLRQHCTNPRTVLARTLCLVPATIVESWLRRWTNRMPCTSQEDRPGESS